ncbi:hypothetical protein ADP71_30500 [Vitreoscilla sp. C1]|uniref:surface-adhesin E family protein n=1 Tax=Vitreoscilla sp. (strain C1) TaxID=96942 RepID=UPI00148E9B16|nr:surface-adhesin E family protein [Vitreoscilla sp. C1]AUZ06245.2 hypothetical protein ADP71_30500 [Vitreoscilla sp. C1]
MVTQSKPWLGILGVVAILMLSACQTTSQVGPVGSWKALGDSANKNVKHEIDTQSIQKNGNVVTYRTRTVVDDIRLESLPNVPVFKTAVSTYQMQCRERSYRILDTELYNQKGVMINQQTFGHQVGYNLVTTGSAAKKQYDLVCPQ